MDQQASSTALAEQFAAELCEPAEGRSTVPPLSLLLNRVATSLREARDGLASIDPGNVTVNQNRAIGTALAEIEFRLQQTQRDIAAPCAPWFEVPIFALADEPDGQELQVSFGDLLAANTESEEVREFVRTAEIGALLRVGGGAAAYSEIRRIV